MAELGVNVPWGGEADPAQVAETGARWVRLVAKQDVDQVPYLQACQANSLAVLLVIARESLDLGDWTSQPDQRMQWYRDTYSGLVNAWQIANEPDNEEPGSSWL